tara:strand:- start:1455 stop:2759 length:1305 start_codon:yes stop_codon:yes gene_type:complete
MNHRKKLHIGMSLSPTWLAGDAWRRDDSKIEDIYGSDFHLDIAKRSEQAKLDFVFRPDTLFLDSQILESGPGFSSLDPTILLASIARETSRIGLLSTASTTFFPPYIVARQIQSLNWLSNGRAGWNIVTALDGNQNFGLDAMPSSDERYERAIEFTEIVRQLWQSYPHSALMNHRASGRYADTSKIKSIDHSGKYYIVKGPLNVPAYGDTPIPLIQAGASETGRDFAASIADAIFAATPDKDVASELRKDLRRRATSHGRNEDDILVLPGLSLYLASTESEARDLYTETHARQDNVKKLQYIKSLTDLDLSLWPTDRPITAADLPPPPATVRSRTHSNLLRRLIQREEPTVETLLRCPEVIGSAHWQVIGTVDDAIEKIEEWTNAGAMDGFISVPGGSVDSVDIFFEQLMPRLSDNGFFRSEYSGNTFYEHLKE